MTNVAPFDHVIWDWNGTLLDDVDLCIDVMNGMLRRRRMAELDCEAYRNVFAFPVRSYYEQLGFDFVAEPFEALAIEYCDEYDARVGECALHRESVDALRAVTRAGATQSILSSSEQRVLDRALSAFGLTGHFASIVGRPDRYAVGKVDTGQALIRRSGVPASRTVLIGDTLHDHEVARALGVACVLVAQGHHSRRRLEAVHDVVLDSLEPVVSLVARS